MRSFSRKESKHSRHGWLIVIALFKLGQALLFAAIGVGALNLVGRDVGDVLTQIADHLRINNPESKMVSFILQQADKVDDHLLLRIGTVTFIYAGLDLLEGIGLWLEKGWAEYLTLFMTGSFLPFEIYEVCDKVTWIRIGLLVVNFMVVLYLARMVWLRRKEHKKEHKSTVEAPQA